MAISSLEESISLRKDGITIPILCLELIDIKYLDTCIEQNITITVHDYEYYKQLMSKEIPMREVVKYIWTSVYEGSCIFNNWVPRVLVKDGRVVEIDER